MFEHGKKHLHMNKTDEEGVDEDPRQTKDADKAQDEDEDEDLSFSPEDKSLEARQRDPDARVAAWKKIIRAEVLAEIMAKQIGEAGEVVDVLADGQAVGDAEAGKDEDSMKTPLKPRISKTVKISDTKKKTTGEDTIPTFEKLVKEELEKRLIEDAKAKTIKSSQFNNDEDEARRQYEDSVAKTRQARERIKRIKAKKEERFKMQIEEQRKEERQRK